MYMCSLWILTHNDYIIAVNYIIHYDGHCHFRNFIIDPTEYTAFLHVVRSGNKSWVPPCTFLVKLMLPLYMYMDIQVNSKDDGQTETSS